jgi:pyruvate dehydrogenase E1 component alpha subunit
MSGNAGAIPALLYEALSPVLYIRQWILWKNKYLDLYFQMVLIRRVEEEASQLCQQGKIGGFLHLYIGQEAVAHYSHINARQGDHCLQGPWCSDQCGLKPRLVMAELMESWACLKQGWLNAHGIVEKNFGRRAVVGAHLPIATGLAPGDQYQRQDG